MAPGSCCPWLHMDLTLWPPFIFLLLLLNTEALALWGRLVFPQAESKTACPGQALPALPLPGSKPFESHGYGRCSSHAYEPSTQTEAEEGRMSRASLVFILRPYLKDRNKQIKCWVVAEMDGKLRAMCCCLSNHSAESAEDTVIIFVFNYLQVE